ncbi:MULTISPECIES: hypothetical protein [Oxalobacteraceae]|uniref:hypothetical protein n=1 Tax=Herminiimonas sp. Marseille-P9896 TaxID=2742211 RepID=UPI00158E3CDE|nr:MULTISPECIES: hypothetical protein [Oxalobacteraceae]
MHKLPSSIKWLLVKRGRIDGSIRKIEEYLDLHRCRFEKYQQLIAELALLRETLASVDQTIQLHSLRIDPSNIPVINGRNPITDMKRGELTRLICEQIKKGQGEVVSSDQIVNLILDTRKEAGFPLPIRSHLTLQVRNRLKALCSKGIVTRHHPVKGTSYGLWTLSEQVIQDIHTEGDDLGNTP